jgi:hypothetical protein
MNKKNIFIILLVISLIASINFINVKASYIFTSGFETNDFSEWTGLYVVGTSPEVQGVIKYAGSYAEKCPVSAWGQSGWAYKSITPSTTFYAQNMVRWDNSITNSRPFCFINIATSSWGNHIIGAGINGVSGVNKWCVAYYDGSTIQIKSSATTAVKDTWYRLEIKLVSNAGAGEVRVYVDGSELVDLATTGLTNNGRTPNYIHSGIWQVSGTEGNAVNVYMDNVILDTSYIGVGGVYTVNISQSIQFNETTSRSGEYLRNINSNVTFSTQLSKISEYIRGIGKTINLFIDTYYGIYPPRPTGNIITEVVQPFNYPLFIIGLLVLVILVYIIMK